MLMVHHKATLKNGIWPSLIADPVLLIEMYYRKYMVNIVQLAPGQKYHVDVAFGGDGPTRPMLLVPRRTFQNLGPQEVRLIYDNIPTQTLLEPKFWIYQY